MPSYQASKPASNSYLPPKSPPQYQPQYGGQRREGSGTAEDPFIITVDGEKYAELNQLPQDFNQILSTPIRNVRNSNNIGNPVSNNIVDPVEHNINTLNSINNSPNHFHQHRAGPVHKRHSGPHHGRHDHLVTAGSDVSVHIVTPEPVTSSTTSEPIHIVKVSTNS